MKIFCCLNDDVLANVALNLLLPSLSGHEVRVGLSARIGAPAVAEPMPRRQLRLAEQGFTSEVLFPLVERAGYPAEGRYLTFREIERHRGIGVVPFPTPNDESGLALLRAFAPDLVLSIRYGAIFTPAAIDVPRLGVLNLHAGLLPAYRGVIATFRALQAEESEIGCTLHYIGDSAIDAGPIVGQARVPVDRDRSLFAHVLSLYPVAIPMVADAIARLGRNETLEARVQAGGSYFSYPLAEEWDAFLRRGWRVVDVDDLCALSARYLPSPGPSS
ncbi:MAG TPA: formyl transferase [Casimicrobiaceae bacterium]|nr:formyl transferase [Casimicrobiaceae bacterium]